MIVPHFWAEGRVQHREQGRQITIRRFGWSDTSQDDAQSNADARANDALQRVLSGEKLDRRERKAAYNGAQGVPIREEIVQEYGDVVITRNSYGARCLNTPNVLFGDIDYHPLPPLRLIFFFFGAYIIAASIAGWHAKPVTLVIAYLGLAMTLAYPTANILYQVYQKISGGLDQMARNRIDHFLAKFPEWNLRIYQTPAGLRVLATQRTFLPSDPAVFEFYRALGVDPIYVRMCVNQQCFRARVSPKPWRMGISQHMRPRPGFWPVSPDRLPIRNAWIKDYETKAGAFAACTFLESKGSGITHPDVRRVQSLHDELSGALSNRPIA